MTNPKTEPRTAAGRDLLDSEWPYPPPHHPEAKELLRDRERAAAEILAIEAEAAEQSAPLDVDRMAEALEETSGRAVALADKISDANGEAEFESRRIAIFREQARQVIARLVDGAQAIPQPREGSQP